MTEGNIPRRHSRRGLKIALVVVLVVLAALAVVLAVKRETVRYILHPEEIAFRPAQETIELLRGGDYTVESETEGEVRYTAMDGAVKARVVTDGEGVERLEAEFNLYDFQVNGLGDAGRYAQVLLSPFFTQPQIEALVSVVGKDMIAYSSADTVDYDRALGGLVVRAAGSVAGGDVRVEAVRQT